MYQTKGNNMELLPLKWYTRDSEYFHLSSAISSRVDHIDSFDSILLSDRPSFLLGPQNGIQCSQRAGFCKYLPVS